MYSNLGKKIMVIGKVMGWLLLIAGIIMWFMKCLVSGYPGDAIIGWISLVTGVVGLISSWFICAFGQLVDDTHAMREKIAGETQE